MKEFAGALLDTNAKVYYNVRRTHKETLDDCIQHLDKNSEVPKDDILVKRSAAARQWIGKSTLDHSISVAAPNDCRGARQKGGDV